MGAVESTFNPVHRRTGGLEKLPPILCRRVFVHRRTGGLEKQCVEGGDAVDVRRRIGGLEKLISLLWPNN